MPLPSLPRRWTLFVLFVAVAFVASLALPVGAPVTIGDGLPSCGAPLLHGITLSAPPSGGFVASGDERTWMASPWCAGARTQRAAELTTFVVLVLLVAATVVWLYRRRRWILDAPERPWVPAGLIAVVLGDVMGIVVGLLVAKRTGTRRMLWTQLGAGAAHLAFALVATLGALLSEHTSPDGGVSWTMFGVISLGIPTMGLPTLLYPLTLLRGRSRAAASEELRPVARE